MMTALMAARNVLGANYDLWGVNTEGEYQEESRESEGALGDDTLEGLSASQPLVPERARARAAGARAVEYEV